MDPEAVYEVGTEVTLELDDRAIDRYLEEHDDQPGMKAYCPGSDRMTHHYYRWYFDKDTWELNGSPRTFALRIEAVEDSGNVTMYFASYAGRGGTGRGDDAAPAANVQDAENDYDEGAEVTIQLDPAYLGEVQGHEGKIAYCPGEDRMTNPYYQWYFDKDTWEISGSSTIVTLRIEAIRRTRGGLDVVAYDCSQV